MTKRELFSIFEHTRSNLGIEYRILIGLPSVRRFRASLVPASNNADAYRMISMDYMLRDRRQTEQFISGCDSADARQVPGDDPLTTEC